MFAKGTLVKSGNNNTGGLSDFQQKWNQAPIITPAQTQTQTPAQTSTPNRFLQKPPLVSNPMNDINAAGADVNAAITGTGKYQGEGSFQRGMGAASTAASAIPNVVADVIPGGKGALNALGTAFNDFVNMSGDVPSTLGYIAQGIGLMTPEQHAQYVKNNADFANSSIGKGISTAADIGQSGGNIASTILGAEGVAKGIPKIPQAATDLKALYDKSYDPAQNGAAAKVKAAVEKDWEKPGSQMGQPKYNKAGQVLKKTPSIPKFLANQKLDPRSLIENKNYATADAATMMRDMGGQLKADMLRPSLKAADYSTPVTQASSLEDASNAGVEKYSGATPQDEESIKVKIKGQLGALKRKYPNGMTLSQMDEEKVKYDSHAGYNPAKSNADNNEAIANRAIGAALQREIEAKAPANLQVHEFNAAISKYYKAADYLDALNGKRAPTSFWHFAANRFAKGAGALLGSMTGGGILVDMAGYMLGGGLESVLEDMSPNLRNLTLRNLEISQPDVFSKVKSYLTNPSGGMLALPPATSDTPIPLGGDTVTPPQSVAPFAKKMSLPSQNPKTGRMMRVYSSEPDFSSKMKK